MAGCKMFRDHARPGSRHVLIVFFGIWFYILMHEACVRKRG
jgi:hypothetical protein